MLFGSVSDGSNVQSRPSFRASPRVADCCRPLIQNELETENRVAAEGAGAPSAFDYEVVVHPNGISKIAESVTGSAYLNPNTAQSALL